MIKHQLVLAEMRALANDSAFSKNETFKCYSKLNQYIQMIIKFTELARLILLDEFTEDQEKISAAIDNFLLRLYQYQVGE